MLGWEPQHEPQIFWPPHYPSFAEPPSGCAALPLWGRKQVDFANAVQRNRHGFPADTKCRGAILPQRGRGPRSGVGGDPKRISVLSS